MDVNTSFIIPQSDASQSRVQQGNRAAEQKANDASNDLPVSQGVLRSTDNPRILGDAQRFHQHSGYDRPSGKGEQAQRAYLSFERESQREQIRGMLGVDLYA